MSSCLKCSRFIVSGGEGGSCDELYLDANCAVHPAVREAKERGLKGEAIYEWVWKYILRVIEVRIPRKLLWIGLDGVAPVAKISHQRQRRFHAAWWGQGENNNMISPGTKFMCELEDYLEVQMDLWEKGRGGCKAVLSRTSEVGEGEHKIMNLLRGRGEGVDRIVYGLDSDLIFLILLLEIGGIWLLRENLDFSGFNLLPIDRLREAAAIRWPSITIQEWTALTMFCGNDFVCGLPSCQIIDGALDWLLEGRKGGGGGEIGVEWLKGWISEISKVEHIRLIESQTERERRIRRGLPLRPGESDVAQKKLEWVEGRCPDVIRVKEAGWENRYYLHVTGGRTREEIWRRMCRDWVKSWVWCWSYYRGKCLDWQWYYPWCAAPLATDLLLFLEEGGGEMIEFEERPPVTIEKQLSLIMPWQSKELVLGKKDWTWDIRGGDQFIWFNQQWLSSCHLKLPCLVV